MNATRESRGDREHREILAAMADIEAIFDRWTGDVTPPSEVARGLGEKISALRSRLRGHFRHEEQEGILSRLDGLDADDRRLVEELLGQHEVLEERIAKSAEEVGGSGGIRGRIPAVLVREMRSLFRDLRRHEAQEGILERRSGRRESGGHRD